MKKLIALGLVLSMVLTLTTGLAESSDTTYTKKLVIQTTNRVIPEGNVIDQWLEEQLGCEIEWMILPSAEISAKFPLLMASDELPDIVSIPSSLASLYYRMVDEGYLLDIEPLIDEYAPGIRDWRTDAQIEALRYTDGHIYAINNRAETDFDMMMVNTAWLENLNLEMPTTLDEFKDMLYAFVHNDPDGNGVDDTYGLGMFSNLRQSFNPIWTAYGANPTQWVWAEDGTVVYGPTQIDKMAPALTYLQELYAEGLLNPDGFTDSVTNVREDCAAGICGVIDDQLWYVDSTLTYLHEYGETWGAIEKLSIEEGGVGGYLNNTNPAVSQYTALTSNCEDVELAMSYLALLSDYDRAFTIRYGIEGVHHYWGEDGVFHVTEAYKGDTNLLIADGVTPTYAMPFLTMDPIRVSFGSNDLLDTLYNARRANETQFYAALYTRVPEIDELMLGQGSGNYVSQVLSSIILNSELDATTELEIMVETLMSDYDLEQRTELTNAYITEMGIKKW